VSDIHWFEDLDFRLKACGQRANQELNEGGKEIPVPVYEIEDKRPRIGPGTWVAPSAEIIGDVEIGENCTVLSK